MIDRARSRRSSTTPSASSCRSSPSTAPSSASRSSCSTSPTASSQAFAFGLGGGFGWFLAIVLIGGIREKINESRPAQGARRSRHHPHHHRHHGPRLRRLLRHDQDLKAHDGKRNRRSHPHLGRLSSRLRARPFAVLLILAEKKILNYGDLPDRRQRRQEEALGTTAARRSFRALPTTDIFIPSACGGRGTCAYCKLKVADGGGMIGPVERPYLSPTSARTTVRLSCQVKVRKDVAIEIPDETLLRPPLPGRPGTQTAPDPRHRRTAPQARSSPTPSPSRRASTSSSSRPNTRATSPSCAPTRSPPFPPTPSTWSSSSVASPTASAPPGSSTYLKEGDEVFLSGPYGFFHLSDTEAPIICIAGGSGMAPIWSIVRDMKEKGIPARHRTSSAP